MKTVHYQGPREGRTACGRVVRETLTEMPPDGSICGACHRVEAARIRRVLTGQFGPLFAILIAGAAAMSWKAVPA